MDRDDVAENLVAAALEVVAVNMDPCICHFADHYIYKDGEKSEAGAQVLGV